MLAVATKETENPINTIAKKLRLPETATPFLQIPNKLIWGGHMLGLGDLVVPGLVLSLLLKFDYSKSGSIKNGYFVAGGIGYAIGLMLAMIMAYAYKVAQPALLYLVPCCLLPIFALGFKRRELSDLWHGLPYQEKNTDI